MPTTLLAIAPCCALLAACAVFVRRSTVRGRVLALGTVGIVLGGALGLLPGAFPLAAASVAAATGATSGHGTRTNGNAQR